MAQKASPSPLKRPFQAVDIASVLKMKSIDLFYLKPLSWLSLRKSVSAANPHKRAWEW